MPNQTSITTEQKAAARRAYQREWRAKNPDKVKKHLDTFWAKKAAEMQQADKNGK